MKGPGAGGFDWRLGLGEYLLAALALAAIVVAAGLIGRALRRSLLPGWSGPPAVLASAVFALAASLLAAELLGLFGLFKLPFYLVLMIVAAAAASTTKFSRFDTYAVVKGESLGGSAPRWWLAAAAVVAGVVLLRALITSAGSYDGGMTGFDTHWYHGPFTALFFQTGDTFALHNSIAPQYLSWFYPHNSELFQAIAILPFERDLLAPALNLFWMAGAMLAAWCIGRPFGLAPLSLIGACLILGSGLMSDQAGEMRNDIPAVCLTLAAAALAVEAWTRHGGGVGRGELVAIGLAAGMAAGTKINYLATGGALILALSWALPRGRRLRGLGWLLAAGFVGGGYWYLRNLVHSGNPLPWISSLGPIDLPGPAQEIGGREPHGVIEYLADAAVWRDWLLPGLRDALTLAWPLIALAALLAVALLIRGPKTAEPAAEQGGRAVDKAAVDADVMSRTRLMRALAATVLATVAAWLVAPASAEGPAGEPVGFVSGLRYLAPALALALALLPVALQPRLVWLQGEMGGDHDPAEGQPGRSGSRAEEPRGSTFGRPTVRALAGLALVALIAGGFALQRSYLADRYAEPDFATPGLNRAIAAAAQASPADEGAPPLAVTATRIYSFYGPDLKRPVAFVGIAEPHGGFRRPETCAEWRRAVNATGAERLIVAWDRIAPGQPPLPPEAAWIAADPAAEQASTKGGVAVFTLQGKLDPATCR